MNSDSSLSKSSFECTQLIECLLMSSHNRLRVPPCVYVLQTNVSLRIQILVKYLIVSRGSPRVFQPYSVSRAVLCVFRCLLPCVFRVGSPNEERLLVQSERRLIKSDSSCSQTLQQSARGPHQCRLCIPRSWEPLCRSPHSPASLMAL